MNLCFKAMDTSCLTTTKAMYNLSTCDSMKSPQKLCTTCPVIGGTSQNAIAASSISVIKKGHTTCVRDKGLPQGPVTTSVSAKTTSIVSSKNTLLRVNDNPSAKVSACLVSYSPVISPHHSGEYGTMSTCDSIKSPDFEYIDNVDPLAIDSLERRAIRNLRFKAVSETLFRAHVAGPLKSKIMAEPE